MNILMTGMTSTQVNGKFAKYARPCFVNAVRLALVEAGHTVKLGPVTVGEDVSGYDALILGLFDCGALGAMKYKWGAMWSYLGYRGRTLFMVEDSEWQLIFGCLYRFWRSAFNAPRPEMEMLGAVARDKVDEVIAVWQQGLPGECVVPAFRWGRDEVFPHKTEGVVRLDMTPYLPQYTLPKCDKVRQWAIASCHAMGEYVEGLQPDWPVKLCCRPEGDGRSWSPVDEGTVVTRYYAPSWGVLNRPYRFRGFGRWRACYPYAARTGSVLHCPEGEAPFSGYQWRVSEIEAMTDSGLASAAALQAEAFAGFAMSKDEFVARLDRAVRRCV